MPNLFSSRRLSLFGLVAFLILTLPTLHYAQSVPSRVEGTGIKLPEVKDPLSSSSQEVTPVEAPVDAKTYRLGPNDQLILSLPALEDARYPLTVSLDNTIVLPRDFPPVDVSGMTLEDLRSKVETLYRARSSSYRNVSLVLRTPRPIRVRVSGDVLLPDTYELTAADRVTTAIEAASSLSDDLPRTQREALLEEQEKRRGANAATSGSVGSMGDGDVPRSVTLRHNDGSSQVVDLLRYRALGDVSQNPTLREGDEVIVRRADLSQTQVSISGAVQSPVVIPYRRGDNALMLMRLASGLRSNASIQGASIYRRTSAGLDQIAIDINDSSALARFELQPGDQLVIPVDPSAVTGGGGAGVVSVLGEVVHPGTFAIIPGTTTLSEIIRTAGGPTQNAALNGGSIKRPLDPRIFASPSGTADAVGMMSTSALPLDDTTRIGSDIAMQQGMVSADFEAVVGRGDRSRDVILQHGDLIFIPFNPRYVIVDGRVRYPGSVDYVPNARLEYYIDRAGGYTYAADPGRIGMKRFGTGVWDNPEETPIYPGDLIYVPGERDTPARTSLEIASTFIFIIATIGNLALAIISFINAQNK